MALGHKCNEEKPLDCRKKRRALPKIKTRSSGGSGGDKGRQPVNAWRPDVIRRRIHAAKRVDSGAARSATIAAAIILR